jgi:hypothetical protein
MSKSIENSTLMSMGFCQKKSFIDFHIVKPKFIPFRAILDIFFIQITD